jgi:hypothetical protein
VHALPPSQQVTLCPRRFVYVSLKGYISKLHKQALNHHRMTTCSLNLPHPAIRVHGVVSMINTGQVAAKGCIPQAHAVTLRGPRTPDGAKRSLAFKPRQPRQPLHSLRTIHQSYLHKSPRAAYIRIQAYPLSVAAVSAECCSSYVTVKRKPAWGHGQRLLNTNPPISLLAYRGLAVCILPCTVTWKHTNILRHSQGSALCK